MRRAPAPEGPWTEPWQIGMEPGRCWMGRCWEDPHVWVDQRNNWHLLAHTYVNGPNNSISGHAFSEDGIHWTYSETEPYTNVVVHTDGTTSTFASMERPQFLFADSAAPWRPTHLVNGVSPIWDDGDAPCG